MPSAEIVCGEDDGNCIGCLQEFPDDWTQGDSLEDLHAHLRDLYPGARQRRVAGQPQSG